MNSKPLIEAPASDGSNTRETLGYIEAYDAVLNGDYADPRHIEYRVRVKNGQPDALEIFLQVRKADHSADEARTLVVPWPNA